MSWTPKLVLRRIFQKSLCGNWFEHWVKQLLRIQLTFLKWLEDFLRELRFSKMIWLPVLAWSEESRWCNYTLSLFCFAAKKVTRGILQHTLILNWICCLSEKVIVAALFLKGSTAPKITNIPCRLFVPVFWMILVHKKNCTTRIFLHWRHFCLRNKTFLRGITVIRLLVRVF